MFPDIAVFRPWFHFPPHLFGQNLNSMIISFTQSTESRVQFLSQMHRLSRTFLPSSWYRERAPAKFNLGNLIFKINVKKFNYFPRCISSWGLLLIQSEHQQKKGLILVTNASQSPFMLQYKRSQIFQLIIYFLFIKLYLIRYQKSGVPPGPDF